MPLLTMKSHVEQTRRVFLLAYHLNYMYNHRHENFGDHPGL